MLAASDSGEDMDSSMPPFSPITSPHHHLVESPSEDDSAEPGTLITVERVCETPQRKTTKAEKIPINAKGHPMVAVKQPRKSFKPTEVIKGQRSQDD